MVVPGRDPDRAAAGRVSIIAADIDPAAAVPFVMSGDPDGAGIRGGPAMVSGRWGRRRVSDLDADSHLRRGGRGAERQDGEGRAREGEGPKRSNFHIGLDLLNVVNLQKFEFLLCNLRKWFGWNRFKEGICPEMIDSVRCSKVNSNTSLILRQAQDDRV